MRAQYPLWDRVYQRLTRHLYWLRADGVVCLSRDTRERFIAAFGDGVGAKTAVVPHGVDSRFSHPQSPLRAAEVRRRYDIVGPYMHYLGMIYPMKNVGRIIQAYARVGRATGRKLVIAGKTYLRAEDDLAWIEKLGVREDVDASGRRA